MADQDPSDNTIGDAQLFLCLIYSRLGYAQGCNPELSMGKDTTPPHPQ